MDNDNQPITSPQFYPNNSVPVQPKKSSKKTLILLVIMALILCGGYLIYKEIKIKGFPTTYYTYVECVEKTKLPCHSQYVGDFGQNWVPSSYKTKEECEAVTINKIACTVPLGDFKETRWVSIYAVPAEFRSNWQTYQNNEFGFEIGYPSAYEISETKIKKSDDFVEATLITITNPADEEKIGFNPTFKINIIKQPYEVSGKIYQTAREFAESKKNSTFINKLTLIEGKGYVDNNLDTHYLVYEKIGVPYPMTLDVFIMKEGLAYELVSSREAADFSEITRSFKFIE